MMLFRHRLAQALLIFLLVAGVSSCGGRLSQDEAPAAQIPAATSPPAASNLPLTSSTPAPERPAAPVEPTSAIVPDSGWEPIEPGLERRVINLADDQDRLTESIFLLRLLPTGFRFDVAYRPGQPLSLTEWLKETGALIVMNGGFFNEAYEATSLVITSGAKSGSSYQDFGGMVAITSRGPEIRWLARQPYDPGENLIAAVQSFPILIFPGHEGGYAAVGDQPARRSVIGQDRQGRILLIVFARGVFTLDGLSRFLANSDLDLDRALNLDGGASSGLLVASPADGVGAYSLLPTVITIYRS